MTNSEAKEVFKKLDYNCARCRRELSPICDEAKNIAISALEENTKLKAEIERLKSELEQIEKSVPRLCDTCNYEYEFHPCDICELKDKWKLKGKVEE